MTLSENIKQLRNRLGLTQAQLAKRLGVTPAAVGNYESGLSCPKGEVLMKMFGALECTPGELFGLELFTLEDYEHLRDYSLLDREGKEAVNYTTFDELERMEREKTRRVQAAARGGAIDLEMKKRKGKSIFDEPDYR